MSAKLTTRLSTDPEGRHRDVYQGRTRVGDVLRVGSLPSCTRYLPQLSDGTNLGGYRTMREAVAAIAEHLEV